MITSLPHNEDGAGCECCGHDPDSCICPECDVCGEVGDLACYAQHGMEQTDEQREGVLRAEEERTMEDTL